MFECQICGWIGTEEELEIRISSDEPGCLSCTFNDFLEVRIIHDLVEELKVNTKIKTKGIFNLG